MLSRQQGTISAMTRFEPLRWISPIAGFLLLAVAGCVQMNGINADRGAMLANKGEAYDFWLYVPSGEPPGDGWPVVMFLHGAGERGDDLERVKIHGPPKTVAGGGRLPFVLIAPQSPADAWWDAAALDGLLDTVVDSLAINERRIYLTGLSMGGYGTWGLLAHRGDRFAAAVPICGGGDPGAAVRFAHVPVWAFHGSADQAVPIEQSRIMIDAMKNAGGAPRMTTYEGVGHDSWTMTYENPAMWEWLLAQRLPD